MVAFRAGRVGFDEFFESLPELSRVSAARLGRTGLTVDDDDDPVLLIDDTDSFASTDDDVGADPELLRRPLESRVDMVRFAGRLLELELPLILVLLPLPLPRLVREVLDTDVADAEAAGESLGVFCRDGGAALTGGVIFETERVVAVFLPDAEAGLMSFSEIRRDVRDGRGVGLEEVVESDFSADFFSAVRFVVSFLEDDTATAGESFLLRFLLLILNAGESVFASSDFFVAVVGCFLFEDFGFSVESFDLFAVSFLAESVFS